jgi:hypothetical protein
LKKNSELQIAARGSGQKRVDGSDGSVEPPVLEVFREQLGKAVALGISPQVSVVPGRLIRGGPAQGRADEGFVGIENFEQAQQFLSLAAGSFGRQQRRFRGLATPSLPSGDSGKFRDCLVRDSYRVILETPVEKLRRYPLFARVRGIEHVHQNICIN